MKHLGATGVLLMLTALSAQAFAADAEGGFEKALAKHYQDAVLHVGAKDAGRWAKQMYSKDVILVGEGYKGPVRGERELMPVLEGLVKEIRRCTIKPDKSDAGRGDIAYSYATWTCTPEKAGEADFSVRALYVWKRGAEGWKVVAEMYGMGEM